MSSITSYMRLEPQTRTGAPQIGLEARIRDPLWLLGRQWELGEFRGEDAGSPVTVAVTLRSAPITGFAPGRGAAIEPLGRLGIEQAMTREAGPPDLRLRMRAGQRLIDALGRAGFRSHGDALRVSAAFAPTELATDDAAELAALVARRIPDGLRLLDVVRGELAGAPGPLHAVLTDWLAWATERFAIGPGAWAPDRLGYELAATTADGIRLVAPAIESGELDWHCFDVEPGAAPTAGATETSIDARPAPVRYPGMPALRFWQFEDDRVSFGDVEIEREDLGRLLLVHFALIGADDWFVVPAPVPLGAVSSIATLTVTDTFGRTTALSPVDAGGAAGTPRWSMFEHTGAATPLLVVPHIAGPALAGEPLEQVRFVRDEAANLGWAIEDRIEGAAGRSQLVASADPAIAPPGPAIAYRLRNELPAAWTPFVPRPIASGAIELARGFLVGGPVLPSHSRLLADTTVLREEELPRDGVTVTRGWRYARGPDGAIQLWRRRELRPGAVTPSRSLAFDILERGTP